MCVSLYADFLKYMELQIMYDCINSRWGKASQIDVVVAETQVQMLPVNGIWNNQEKVIYIWKYFQKPINMIREATSTNILKSFEVFTVVSVKLGSSGL